MGDLELGFLFVGVLGIAALYFGRVIACGLGVKSKRLVVLGCIILICVFRAFVEDNLRLALLFQASGTLAFIALSPVFACLAVGIGWELLGPSRWRRMFISIILVGISIFASNRMYFDRTPIVEIDYRSGGWVLQSSEATCGPASAANLLKVHGISTDESTMVRLCLTTERGTTRLGLYRGMKRILTRSHFDVRPYFGNVDQLINRNVPAIIFVELRSDKGIDPRYVRNWSWQVGLKHIVLFLGREGENVRIVDPSFGSELWSIEALRLLYQEEAIELVDRNSK